MTAPWRPPPEGLARLDALVAGRPGLAELDALVAGLPRVELQPDDAFYSTPELKAIFRVDSRTVRRWMRRGRIAYTRTPGGFYRFPACQVNAMLRGGPC